VQFKAYNISLKVSASPAKNSCEVKTSVRFHINDHRSLTIGHANNCNVDCYWNVCNLGIHCHPVCRRHAPAEVCTRTELIT